MQTTFLDGRGRRFIVRKVVAQFEICSMGELPFAAVRVEVTESGENEYCCSPNVVVRNTQTEELEYLGGFGNSVEASVQDFIVRFFAEVDRQSATRELGDSDFFWQCGNDWIAGKP